MPGKLYYYNNTHTHTHTHVHTCTRNNVPSEMNTADRCHLVARASFDSLSHVFTSVHSHPLVDRLTSIACLAICLLDVAA